MTGAITGTVTDNTGAVVPGVTIVISSAALMGTRTTVTNAEGLYRFPALAPGEYTLVFTLDGFARQARRHPCRRRIHRDHRCRAAHRDAPGKRDRRAQLAGHRQAVDRDCRHLRCPSARKPAGRPKHVGHSGGDASRVHSRFDLGASAGGPRRRNQRLRNGRLQWADGRRNQRHRHQPDGLYPGLWRVRGGLGEHGRSRAGVAMPGVQMQFISKSGGNQYRGTLYVDYWNRDWQSFNIDEAQIHRGAQGGGGCHRARPIACGVTATSTPILADTSNPTRSGGTSPFAIRRCLRGR